MLGFKCSSRRLHELMKEKDIGRDGLITFKNVLQLVYRLQGDAYDLHSEIEQVYMPSINCLSICTYYNYYILGISIP